MRIYNVNTFREACVALVAADKVDAMNREVIEKYMRSGFAGRVLVPEVS